jgi:hypothetical protein
VEFIFASRALQGGESERFRVQDRVADRTRLHSLKFFVDVPLPKEDGIKDRAVMLRKELNNLHSIRMEER